MLVDIHTHLIPNVDDGADSQEMSLKLAYAALDEKIDRLILTPHHNTYFAHNPAEIALEKGQVVKDLFAEHDIPLEVRIANEVHIDEHFQDVMDRGEILPLDPEDRYVLLELPYREFFDYVLPSIQCVIDKGYTPIIAHPERFPAIQEDYQVLVDMIDMGCLTQVTASAYTGATGLTLEKAARDLVALDLIHLMASDAHHVVKRPFNFLEAYQMIEADHGPDMCRYLQENAERVFEGRSVEIREPKV